MGSSERQSISQSLSLNIASIVSSENTVTQEDHSARSTGQNWFIEYWQGVKNWVSANRWPVVGIVLACLLTYAPVVQFEFINWDDPWYIENNDIIKGWHPANLYAVATQSVARNFAPLTIFTFLVEHTLWGLWSGGYHLTNVLLHVVNALLVFALIKRLSGNALAAWTIAILFGLHPVQVETVAWVSSRKTLLSATFMLASCLCWLRTERTAHHEKWGIIWLVCGLLSKAATVVIPPIVVAYDVLIARKKFSESVARQIVPMFFSVMLILITMSAQTTIVGGVRGHIGASKLWIIAIDATILWRYVAMSFWPQDLCVLYDPATTGILHWIALSLITWGAIAYAAYKYRERYPLPVFCFATWLLLLFPVLNIFPITTLMNDRYLYLPLVPFFGGVFALAGIALQSLPNLDFTTTHKNPLPAMVTAIVLSAAACGFYCLQTQTYLPTFANPVALWSHARQTTPSLPVIHIQWAITLHDEGYRDEAIQTLESALLLNPDDGDRHRIEEKIAEWSQSV